MKFERMCEIIIEDNELCLKGICNTTEREVLIEEAIQELQRSPYDCFLPAKTYPDFRDQREDCLYMYPLRHEGVVFIVGRGVNYKPECAKEYIEVLFAVRDFKGVSIDNKILDLKESLGCILNIKRKDTVLKKALKNILE